MKLIINAEITKGYETWKNLFLSVEHIREKYGVKVLALVILKKMKARFIKY